MSGIFGYITKSEIQTTSYLQPLFHWNQSYGRQASHSHTLPDGAMGCHVEHLTEAFPHASPVLRREGKLAVIDAVLYNREELMEPAGCHDDAIPDEELLLNLVLRQGYDSLAEVNGDFAGAVYDEAEQSWTLFRDHSGVRPLYYYMDKELFAFSTDMRGIVGLPKIDLSVNEDKLYFRMAGYNDLTLCETEYQYIRCIRPAAWTVVRQTDGGFHMQEHLYWKWRQNKIRMKSDEDYQQELRRLITDAVSRRLNAYTGIVGCELSGGLDSSVIAILISRLGREGRFFSWSYSTEDIPLQERDERKIIQDICEQENIRCSYAKIRTDRSIAELFAEKHPPYVNTRLITDGSTLLAQQGARVVFTGHGGDEGVSHRCNFYELWYHHEYFAFFRNIYRGTRGKKLRLLRTVKRSLHYFFKQFPYFRAPYYNWYNNASVVLNPDFAKRMSQKTKPKALTFAYDPVQYVLQGGHRVRLDNVAVQGAACGVRYMLPFVDYRVLDFAFSIPRAQFHNGYNNRYIYRAAFDDMIPQSLREMHYKDTPSQQDYMPDVDLGAHFVKTKQELLEHTDPVFWKDYLDLEAFQALEIPENYTRNDYMRASGILNEVASSLLIHNTIKHAAVGSENCGQ